MRAQHRTLQEQKRRHPPVQVVNEVTHIIWQNDSMLTHVTVVAQHAHRHMGWHFGKLPENIVEGPSKREGVFRLSCVALGMLCTLPLCLTSQSTCHRMNSKCYNLSLHP